jgi:hypothetical protein
MPSTELRIRNRTAYFRKAISKPIFDSESVLSRDAFEFVELWLTRNCTNALPYWKQARAYYEASKMLDVVSAPLTTYYCFLNATKALLLVKGISFTDNHGVTGGRAAAAKRVIANEEIEIKGGGVLAALSSYLGETNLVRHFNVADALGNLPFIHRAYRHTFRAKPELFIPLRNPLYRKHPTDPYVWFSAEVRGAFADARVLRTLPNEFEVDVGLPGCVIRTKRRSKWHPRGASAADKSAALSRLWSLHRRLRRQVSFISAPVDLWYLKRNVAGATTIPRSNMVLVFATMHRLSELSRYDPAGLGQYLAGPANWLLSEFVRLSPAQFIDEIACEMTSLEMRLPGVRS